jgi:ABC-type arginine transport system ATPase subunit
VVGSNAGRAIVLENLSIFIDENARWRTAAELLQTGVDQEFRAIALNALGKRKKALGLLASAGDGGSQLLRTRMLLEDARPAEAAAALVAAWKCYDGIRWMAGIAQLAVRVGLACAKAKVWPAAASCDVRGWAAAFAVAVALIALLRARITHMLQGV